MTNEWLSDDTSLIVLEQHEANVKKLCETLSPMQIKDDTENQNGVDILKKKIKIFATTSLQLNDKNVEKKELFKIDIIEQQQNFDSELSLLTFTQNSKFLDKYWIS